MVVLLARSAGGTFVGLRVLPPSRAALTHPPYAQIDVPSHASGFAPLVAHGVEFCDDTNSQLFNDPSTNATFDVVTGVLALVADVFPDPMFHLGGDETVPTTKCPLEAIHLFERQLQVCVCVCWFISSRASVAASVLRVHFVLWPAA